MKIKFTDSIHFLLGAYSVIFNIQVPITIIFVAYEIMDCFLQIRAKEKEGCSKYSCYTEEKEELRRDLGFFVAGLFIGSLI